LKIKIFFRPAAAVEIPVQLEPEPDLQPVAAVVEPAPEPTPQPEPIAEPVQPVQEPEPVAVIPVSVEEPIKQKMAEPSGESSPDFVPPQPPPPTPAEPTEDLVETSIKQQLVIEPAMRQIEIIALPEPGVDIPVASEEPVEEPVAEIEE